MYRLEWAREIAILEYGCCYLRRQVESRRCVRAYVLRTNQAQTEYEISIHWGGPTFAQEIILVGDQQEGTFSSKYLQYPSIRSVLR